MPWYVRWVRVTALPADAEEAARGHVEQVRALREEGKIRAAGALADGDGFVEIFEAKDLLEADDVARASPLVEGGLATWIVREWHEL